MAKLDLRVRLLGRALGALSVSKMDNAKLERTQQNPVGHNPVTDLLLGGMACGVTVTESTAAGADGQIPIRVYRPKGSEGLLPLVVNFHGGGWTVGSLNQADWLCSNVAVDANVVVVSIDYRLAPKHRWPAAADDCFAALIDLVVRAREFEADPQRLAVMGDSAGGNLAAVVALMARDYTGPSISFQALLYPATDLTLSSPSLQENANAPILTKDDAVAYRDHYLGGQDPTQPFASPLLALDHTGLPPALVQVAEHDPIRDDGLRYAAALRNAGVKVRTTTYVGMPHGYLSFPKLCRSAPQALAELSSELKEALTTTA